MKACLTNRVVTATAVMSDTGLTGEPIELTGPQWGKLSQSHRLAISPSCLRQRTSFAEGLEKDVFKPRVRRLKELGLTESLEVGYRLSPRGEDALTQLRSEDALKRLR